MINTQNTFVKPTNTQLKPLVSFMLSKTYIDLRPYDIRLAVCRH